MLAKLDSRAKGLEPSLAEELADLMFEIGYSQFKCSVCSEAIYWLEKAHDLLSGQNLEALTNDAGELLISIMHATVRALMTLEGKDNRTKAWNIVHKLDLECADRLAVLLLKLDLYATDLTHSPQNYCDVLQKLVHTAHITDTNIKTILHHVHKLRGRSPPMAHTILVSLLSERLLAGEEPRFLEKALITIIWNCTTSPDFVGSLKLLGELLDTLADGSIRALSASATHAAQTVGYRPLPYRKGASCANIRSYYGSA